MTIRAPSLLVLSALALCACAPSEQEIQQEFAEEVERSNDCHVDSECVIADAVCPLGCWVIVNVQFKARVEQKARELVEDYEAGGESCVYDCQPAPAVACLNSKCAAAP